MIERPLEHRDFKLGAALCIACLVMAILSLIGLFQVTYWPLSGLDLDAASAKKIALGLDIILVVGAVFLVAGKASGELK